jgi:hypothetical protein
VGVVHVTGAAAAIPLERIGPLLTSESRRSELPEPPRVDAVLLHLEVQSLVVGAEEPCRLALVPGLAGILWVPLNGLVTPDVLYWPQSGKIVFFAVLGGFRNFAGPIVGAVIFNYLEVYAVALTQYWQITLGLVLIALVTFLPAGIVGSATRLGAKFK